MAVDLLPPADPSITQGTPEDMYYSALYRLITETGYDRLLAEAVGIAGLRRLVGAVDDDAAALGRQGVFTLHSLLAGSMLDLGEEDEARELLTDALAALAEDEGWVIDGSHSHAADVLARLGEPDSLLLPLVRTEEDTVVRGGLLLDCALPFLARGLLDPGLDLLREAVGYLQTETRHGYLTYGALVEAAAALVRTGSPDGVDEGLAVARSIPVGRGTDHAGHESCYRAEALAAIARALLDQGHEEQALELAAEAHEATWDWAWSRPKESQLLAAAAKALAATGSPEADEMARRAIEAGMSGSRSSGRGFEQAFLHRLVGEPEVARSLIERAITDAACVEYEEDEYYPDPTVSLGSLCSPLLELGERQLAEQVAGQAWESARHPKELFRDEDWAIVVSAYVDCGLDPRAAHDAASEALGVDRDDDDHEIPDGVLARLAEGLALGGDEQRVREIARQIARTCPFCSGYAETYARLGRAYLALGRPETTHALLDQALMIAQRSRGHRLGQIVPVAEAFLAVGRAGDVSDLVSLPCMSGRALADLGKVLGKAGEKEAAIAALRRSLLEADGPGQWTAALESVCEMMGVWSRGELILEVVGLTDRNIG
jgi:tetratricopeptide (TPR) repeat protein